ncbi:hypothetical protein DERF_007290 [Dermatophagoides farinae]|uniref:Uncharacterized protein n=1 Tax=Dermatophagoides farinae TaxID=6954 RepID=A0A922I069_DERFA|nr:hypothetical protein DERF_007290 [Dermatophagoides farinae]
MKRKQQHTKEMEPLFPMNLATKPIIVTNGDNIVMNKNNNKIKHNNDNPSENETKLSEQNGIFDGHKNDKSINNSMAEKLSTNPQLQYQNHSKDDEKMIQSLSSAEAAVINDKLDSISSANSSNNDSSPHHQNRLQTSSAATNSTTTHTHQSKKSPKKNKRQLNYSRPPDGGWGWMVVFASFIINLIADGVSLSFGVIFVELVNYFNESKSKTAWIGSLFLSIPLLTGPIGSSLVDQFGCRKVTIAGALLASAGFFIGQYSTCVEHLFFAFSLAGFGLALCYVTSIVSVAYWFDRRRSLATGLAVCGSGFGTFLFAPLIILLLKEYGWRGTLLILSGVFLNMVCCGFLIPDVNIDTSGDVSSSSSSNSGDTSDLDSNLSDSDDNFDIDNQNDRLTSITGNLSQEQHRLLLKQHSVMARPLSESHSNDDSFPRHTSSLINIPTFIKNNDSQDSSNNNKNEMQSNNIYGELTFRRGGYLHNLICHYPHLLSMFLPWDMQCDDLTVKTKVKLQSNTTPVPLISSSPVPPKATQKVVEFGSTHHMDSHSKLNGIINSNGDVMDSNKATDNGGILKSSTNSRQNSTSRFGQLLNFARQSQHFNNNNNNDVLFNQHQQQTPRINRLRHLRLPRGSLTYRNAMLVINKYRLKASSAPDIYRTSMATINEEKSLNFYENLKEILINMIDMSIFKSFRYSIFCLSNFLLYVCIDVPYVYIPDQVITSGASDKDGASQYISIIGVFNTFGVVFVGYIGDKPWLDASFIYSILVSISGLVMAAIPLTTDSYLISIQSAIYGFCISANYSLVSVILVELISLDSFTTAYGMLLLVQGFGSLIGPPLAGWIFDISGNYDNAFYITGITIMLSGILVLPVGRKKNCFLWRNQSDDEIESVLKDRNGCPLSNGASSPSCKIKNDNKHSKPRADTTIEEDSEI